MIQEFNQLINKYANSFVEFLPKLFLSLIVILISYFAAKRFSHFLKKRVVKRMQEELMANFAAKIAGSILFLIGFIIAMEMLGLSGFTGGILAGAGGSALIFGFAFKDIGENFLSGVILAFNRPFRTGDMIEIEKISGRIVSLDLRTTIVRTFEGYDVFIPNSMMIKNPLINYHRQGLRRFDFKIAIDYKDDFMKAKTLIMDEIVKIPEILTEPPPMVVIYELSPNSIVLLVFYWINARSTERNFFEVKSEAIENVVTAFEKGGINIPYNTIQVEFNRGIPDVKVSFKEKA